MNQKPNGRTRSADRYPTTQLRVKRSVSPDGRIDSLSVELISPVDNLDADGLVRRVRDIIASETKAVEVFLATNQARDLSNGKEAATSAHISAVGGMDTEWGRRLFLIFEVGDETTRIFGSPRKLARVLGSAGVEIEESEIGEGLELDVDCQVATGRTSDGRYLTIEKVLPASTT